MLIERRFKPMLTVFPQGPIPNDRKQREQHTTLLLLQALGQLYSGEANQFITIIRD